MATQPTDPGTTGKAVGIDLGTTNSLVAYVEGRGAKVACLPVDEGSTLLPSAVAYVGGEILVGRAARRLGPEHPRAVIVSAKRFVGKRAADADLSHIHHQTDDLATWLDDWLTERNLKT